MVDTKASELIAALQAESEKRGYDLDVIIQIRFVDIGGETETVWSDLDTIEVFNGIATLKGV